MPSTEGTGMFGEETRENIKHPGDSGPKNRRGFQSSFCREGLRKPGGKDGVPMRRTGELKEERSLNVDGGGAMKEESPLEVGIRHVTVEKLGSARLHVNRF